MALSHGMPRGWTRAGLGLALLAAAAGLLRADPVPTPSTPATVTEVGGKTFKQWLQDLSNDDPSVREEAITAITLFPNADEAVPALVKRLLDHDASPRSAAVLALARAMEAGKINDKDRPKVIEALGNRLTDDTPSPVRYQAAKVLGLFGKDAHQVQPALLHGVEDSGSYMIRIACIADLTAAGMTADRGPEPAVTRALLGALGDHSLGYPGDHAAGVRLQAIMTMAEMGPPQDEGLFTREKSALREATKDKDKTVAIWAHLGLMGVDKIDADGIAFLKGCTHSDELLRVRVQGVRALGMVAAKEKDVVPAIVDLMGDADPQMAASACLALADAGDPGPKAVDALAAVAKSTGRSAATRIQAVQALGAIGAKSKAVVKPLLDLLSDPDHDVAAYACMSLGFISDPPLDLNVEGRLMELSKNKDPEEGVRRAAAAALELMHRPKK